VSFFIYNPAGHRLPPDRFAFPPSGTGRAAVRKETIMLQSNPLHELIRTAAAMLALLIVAPLIAAEAPKPQDPMPSFFSETTVTATGTERDVFEIATPVTVIRQEQIDRKAPQNAADLLREQPGVDVNGVGPNQARPVIRGQRGHRVLFLENGLRMNNARRQTDFGEITGLVDMKSVGTIEVVRGPASVLYGSDAIGGVLNLVSREPRFAPGSSFNGFADVHYAGAGRMGSGSAGLNARVGRFTLQSGATIRKSDDYTAPAGRFGNVRLSNSTRVNDTSLEDRTIWGSIAFKANDRDRFVLRFNSYRADETGFGYVDAADYGATEPTSIRILYPRQSFDRLTLSYMGAPLQQAWGDSTHIQVYRQANKRQLANNIEINIGPVAPRFPDSGVHADTLNDTDLTTTGVRADAVKALGRNGRHIVTYGFEGYRDRSLNTDFSTTTTTIRTPYGDQVVASTDGIANAPNATNTSYGVFLQDEISLTSRLRITPGVRYHTVSTEAEATPGWNVNGLSFKDRNVVGAITATYQVATYLNVLASFGSAFRAPNIIERLFNGPTPEGEGYQLLNSSLTSETSRNWDLGLKYRRNDAFMEVVGFRNDIQDGVIQAYLSPGEIAALPQATQDAIKASGARFVVQQRNTDRLRYEGVELAVGYHAPAGLTVGGNFTYIDGVRVDSINPPTGDSYRSKVFAYARWEPTASRFWAEYHVRHNGATDANLAPNSPVPALGTVLPAFTLHGVGAGATLFETMGMNHTVTLWVENLTNKLYAEFSNATFFRPEPGRTAKVSYRINF
jgi:hemoglobin/transferrin/lactoferrin receptor protein